MWLSSFWDVLCWESEILWPKVTRHLLVVVRYICLFAIGQLCLFISTGGSKLAVSCETLIACLSQLVRAYCAHLWLRLTQEALRTARVLIDPDPLTTTLPSGWLDLRISGCSWLLTNEWKYGSFHNENKYQDRCELQELFYLRFCVSSQKLYRTRQALCKANVFLTVLWFHLYSRSESHSTPRNVSWAVGCLYRTRISKVTYVFMHMHILFYWCENALSLIQKVSLSQRINSRNVSVGVCRLYKEHSLFTSY